MVVQGLDGQIGKLLENHHVSPTHRWSEQAKQRLSAITANMLELVTDLCCKRMGGIHHPTKTATSIK